MANETSDGFWTSFWANENMLEAKSPMNEQGSAAGAEFADESFASGVIPMASAISDQAHQQFESSYIFDDYVNQAQWEHELNSASDGATAIGMALDIGVGSLPPLVTFVSAAFSPSVANAGEQEYFEDQNVYSNAFAESARDTFSNRFDDLVESQRSPDPEAWRDISDFSRSTVNIFDQLLSELPGSALPSNDSIQSSYFEFIEPNHVDEYTAQAAEIKASGFGSWSTHNTSDFGHIPQGGFNSLSDGSDKHFPSADSLTFDNGDRGSDLGSNGSD